jgi:hypothetical protein
MSHNNDNSGMLYTGGIVVFIIVVGILIKILKTIVIELSELFTAIAKMASAFISMAWQITQVIGLLSLGVLAIYAAWVFSKKYYQLVKDATDVKEQIDNKFSDLQSELRDSYKTLKRDAVREIFQMRKELDAALKRSEVVPGDQAKSESASGVDVTTSVAVTTSADQVNAASANEQTAGTASQAANNEINHATTQIQDAPKDISNPF